MEFSERESKKSHLIASPFEETRPNLRYSFDGRITEYDVIATQSGMGFLGR